MKRNHLIYLKIIDLLKDGAFNKSSGYHTFVFSSLSLKEVQSRYVVLRNFIEKNHNLIFFTDKRSPKVKSITKNNLTECLFYDKFKKIQLRIKTKSFILRDNIEIRKYWDKVPLTSRKSYSTKLAPSSTVDTENKCNEKNYLSDKNAFSNFCVVENYIREIDFLSLITDTHERMKIMIENNQIKIKELIPYVKNETKKFLR